MSDSSENELSEDDFSFSNDAYAKLVDNIINSEDKQYIKKASRTEPTTLVSEFNLVNSLTGEQGSINLQELTNSLKNDKKQSKVPLIIKGFQKSSQTLEKPLEKPDEERLKRTVGYHKVIKELDRWEPIVTHNRASANLSFPLEKDVNLNSGKNFVKQFKIKSDIEIEMEKVEATTVAPIENIDQENNFPLSLEEIRQQRQETAKLRALQSYKAAKEKREKKIKSKKFHRLQKKDKIKKTLKEFEELKKNNPDEALKKLEEIETARAQERATLRHKNTGKWAQNKQVRAKYDKESREALSQQLQISRELTQKNQVNLESESESDEAISEIDTNDNDKSNDNPWIELKPGVSNEMGEFLSGYKKFLVEKKSESEIENREQRNTNSKKHHDVDKLEENETSRMENKLKKNKTTITAKSIKNKHKFDKISKQNSKVKKCTNSKELRKENQKQKKKSKTQLFSLNKDYLMNHLPYIIENNLRKRIELRVEKIKKELHLDEKTNVKSKNKKSNKSVTNLALPRRINKPEFDEEMVESIHKKTNEEIIANNSASEDVNSLEKIINLNTVDNCPKNDLKENDIDPKKIMNAKPTELNTEIPDLISYDENMEDDSQKAAIAEAFEDDEIIEDFTKEQKNETEKEKPEEVYCYLPGWGKWEGAGIKISETKRKRFINKFIKKDFEKSFKKKHTIIKENKKSVKPHMVSEVPFPFKNVKDFEASVRAPIGNTFVPETSFRKNILPAVRTKMGSIIEPIDEEILLKKKKN